MHKEHYSENADIQWALELLKPDPDHELGFLQKYISEILLMGCGFTIPCMANMFIRRPALANIRVHAMSVVGGYILSQYINKVVDNYKVERDTRLRNYVIRHPELFPKPVHVKYADILEPWIPIR